MIILPNKNIPRANILMPMLAKEWRVASSAQPKDQFGNENHSRWELTARANDGFKVWTGTFYDRDDADSFLYALVTGQLRRDKSLWRLPTPQWQPWMGEELTYEFYTVTYLVSPVSSLQTYSRPSDWTDSDNWVELISGGAGGRRNGAASVGGGGGGAGAYAVAINIALASSVNWQCGDKGNGGTSGVPSGGNGGGTWFGNTSVGASIVGANGGIGATTSTGGAGANSGVGPNGFANGGSGGSGTSLNNAGGGGGGAGGYSGAGGNGTNNTTSSGGDGGNGNAGIGGVGATANGGTGGNGNEWGTNIGSGGGGGGGGAGGVGGAAGVYGAGGGGNGSGNFTPGATGGQGAQGLIRVVYAPYVAPNVFHQNMPMMGM